MTEKLGEFSAEVVKTLALDVPVGTAIYVGVSNIAHMSSKHDYDFNRYFSKMPSILSSPDYVRIKEDDGSIEYIKIFGKYVKLAVRVAGDGKYYARSLYTVRNRIVERMVKNGELKPLTKS